MFTIKASYFIIILSLLIICQSIYLYFRLKKVPPKVNQINFAQIQQLIENNLRSVPEPVVETQIVKGAKLWCQSADSAVEIEIWAESDSPVVHADLKLFYPSSVLEIKNKDVVLNKESGLISWFDDFEEPKTGRFKLTTLSYKLLSAKDAVLTFDFTKASDLDSNLLDFNNVDLLETVDSKSCQIKNQ